MMVGEDCWFYWVRCHSWQNTSAEKPHLNSPPPSPPAVPPTSAKYGQGKMTAQLYKMGSDMSAVLFSEKLPSSHNSPFYKGRCTMYNAHIAQYVQYMFREERKKLIKSIITNPYRNYRHGVDIAIC